MHVAKKELDNRGDLQQYNLRHTTLYNLPAHHVGQVEKEARRNRGP